MTREEAIKILDPKTPTKALMEILYQHDYMSQAVLDALNLAVAALQNQPEWIPVTERLPESNETVLVYRKFWDFGMDRYDGKSFIHKDVTHWIPMPRLPEKV